MRRTKSVPPLILIALAFGMVVIAPAAAQAGWSKVWRTGHVVHIRGSKARSNMNFGTGLYANGITDYWGKLKTGRGCSGQGGTVTCSGNWDSVKAKLRGGTDEFGTIIPITLKHVDGGAGRDSLSGDIYNDKLIGGPGMDEIYCGSGIDVAIASTKDKVAKDCEIVKHPKLRVQHLHR